MNNKEMYRTDLLKAYSSDEFEKEYTYTKNDLGATWNTNKTMFKLWSPIAENVKLNLYKSGDEANSDLLSVYKMTKSDNGVWICELNGDFENVYYTYNVCFKEYEKEICDPYAKAVGVNGKRSMVIDLSKTNPENWDDDKDPNSNMAPNEFVICELHVRDLSSDENSGITNTGKFLGLAQEDSYIPNHPEVKTGLSHIKELGVTHIHLLPFYDYATIDESKEFDHDKYNWGYDPLNYNVPEGSYSTNVFDGATRIKELKQTVKKLHENGISLIMDVVYNHTFSEDFCFNGAVPGYFYRIDESKVFSNGSACGNDVASERSMVSKYIVDSIVYWANEYHIDGFRFDLLGLLDVETINKVREELDKIRPDIFLYGEGWHLNTKLTKKNIDLATQTNINKLNRMAMFSDNLRDALKGSVFIADEKGFISGNEKNRQEIINGVMGLPEWSDSPIKVINYTSCHDNYTLFDKIALSNENISFDEQVKQNKLAAAIVMLSQGIPLIHAGEELLREKKNADGTYVSDSVNSPDSVNSIKWSNLLKPEYKNVNDYYKGLISFRKENELLHLTTKKQVSDCFKLKDVKNDLIIEYSLCNKNEELLIIINADNKDAFIDLDNDYNCYVDENRAGVNIISSESKSVCVKAKSCKVLKRNI